MIAKILPEPHRSALIKAGKKCIAIARVNGNMSAYCADGVVYKRAAMARDEIIAALSVEASDDAKPA